MRNRFLAVSRYMPLSVSVPVPTPADRPQPADRVQVGLTAVIIAVTREVPRVLVVRRHSQDGAAAPEQSGWDALPFGPFSPDHDRTLEQGLRRWVAEQTGLPLGYVEQLYTFGDRYRDLRELEGGTRVVSVGYIALAREAPVAGSGAAAWQDWYSYFPWEDWRDGRPAVIDQVIRPALDRWCATDTARQTVRRDRIDTTFTPDDEAWDTERVLERYELLYEAGLVAEAPRDRAVLDPAKVPPPCWFPQPDVLPATGTPMAQDNRRILAAALGRVRGKLKYRPVVFDLLPAEFTLFHLQRLVEALSGMRLHKQNFRRLVIAGGLVEATGRLDSRTGGRPAELYRFRRDVLRERAAAGVGLPTIRITE